MVGSLSTNLLKLLIPITILSLGFWIVVVLFDRHNPVVDGDGRHNQGYRDLH